MIIIDNSGVKREFPSAQRNKAWLGLVTTVGDQVGIPGVVLIFFIFVFILNLNFYFGGQYFV